MILARTKAVYLMYRLPVADGGEFAPLSEGSRSLLDSLLGQAAFGVAVFDHALRYLWINDTLARQNGPTPDEHVGRGFIEVLPHLEGSFDLILARVRDERESMEVDIEGPVPGRSNEDGNARVAVHPVALGEGLGGVGVIVVDSTERVRAERELEQSVRRLDDLGSRQRLALDALQRGFLPRRLPDGPMGSCSARYSAAADVVRVGGDWYDAFESGDAIYLCVGDVAGHGLDAVDVMAQLRHAARAWFYEAHEPHIVLEHLNTLTAAAIPNEYATAIIAAFDPSTMCLSVAAAGHPPPFIAHHDGTVDMLSIDAGPLLGAFPGVRYGSISHPVAVDDTVVLYTDGLIERRGENIDAGLRRLRDALAPRTRLSLDALVEEVHDAMFADTLPDDDVCILAYRPAATTTRPTAPTT